MDSNFIKSMDSFVDEVIGYLPDYLRKDNLTAFLTIFLNRLEALDDAFIQLAEYRLLLNAEGVVLDDIGKQSNILRNGKSDDDYRTLILIKQASANKGGTRPQVSEILTALFSDNVWELYKGTNHRVDVYAYSPCFDISTLASDVVEVFPLSCHLRIIETIPAAQGFGFAGDENALGFGSSNDRTSSDAGALLKIVYTSDYEIHGTT